MNCATPLMAACYERNIRRVRKLLKAGADPNEYWEDGGNPPMSPLSVARESGAGEIERLLIAAGGGGAGYYDKLDGLY